MVVPKLKPQTPPNEHVLTINPVKNRAKSYMENIKINKVMMTDIDVKFLLNISVIF